MWLSFVILGCSTPETVATPPSTPAPSPAAPAPSAPQPRKAARAPADRPPTIDTITLTPAAPTASDVIVAEVKAHDAENARLDYDFAWFVNDVPVIGVDSERLMGRTKKGDRVRVRVTADDGTTEVSADSEPLVVANTAPTFDTGPKDMKKVDGFAFRASDPDGDALTWSLAGAPRGMSISPTGVLAYQGSEDEPGGAYTVTVKASDGDAFAAYEFPLTVSAGSKAKSASK